MVIDWGLNSLGLDSERWVGKESDALILLFPVFYQGFDLAVEIGDLEVDLHVSCGADGEVGGLIFKLSSVVYKLEFFSLEER